MSTGAGQQLQLSRIHLAFAQPTRNSTFSFTPFSRKPFPTKVRDLMGKSVVMSSTDNQINFPHLRGAVAEQLCLSRSANRSDDFGDAPARKHFSQYICGRLVGYFSLICSNVHSSSTRQKSCGF